MNLNDQCKSVFLRIRLTEPSETLCERIQVRIHRARVMQARRHAAIHGVLVIGCLIMIVPIVTSGLDQAAQSGLYDYVSLVLSDGTYLLANWRQTVLSLLESVPIMSVILSMGIVLILANSVRRGARYVPATRLFGLSP